MKVEEMNISKTPDKWVVLKMTDKNQSYYRVFGTWGGGYLQRDSWRMNSGIKNFTEDDDYYYFIGFSGSCYKCKKSSYGVATAYGHSIISDGIKQSPNHIEIMDEETNWNEIDWGD